MPISNGSAGRISALGPGPICEAPTTGRVETSGRIPRISCVGVLLRRKLDYSYANQRAEIFLDAATAGPSEWKSAGVWLMAGSATCVFSNPGNGQELAPAEHIVELSNRRFRDDEFLVPVALTRGRSKIHVRVQFWPRPIPLFPGDPLPELGWSEMRSTAYSFVVPRFELAPP